MAGTPTLLPESRLGSTLRHDAWWTEIFPVVIVLGGFGIYATLRAFEGKYYEWGPYLSPFYSPLIDPEHRWWKFSPALLILAGPLGFRATCYYYRKAYYRAFFWDPPACAVGEFPRRDAIRSFFFDGYFGIGVGTLVLTINVTLLSLYTFSCHSLRHLAGGKVDCFSCATFGRSRFEAWSFFSFLNEHHMLFAWCSLVSVGFADFYVRMVASDAFRDLRLL